MNVHGVTPPGKLHGAGEQNLNRRLSQYRDTGVNFADLIQEKAAPQELRFSAHAENRIKSRGINMNEEVKQKLMHAADKAAQKGGKETLLLTNDSAFIVNIKNRTVVTAMDNAAMKENVFTNIDSAVITE
ncbi:MAG: TIGR02530 family flagellar biosynthesis protein [Fibrobacterota bacterium]